MIASSHAGVIRLDVPFRPDELVAAWRPESRRLLLPAREPLRLQQRVAARISALGLGVAATIAGRVTSASRQGELHRIELAPDDIHVRAVERLLSIASGQRVQYRVRAPRFLAAVPAVVYGPAGPTYMTTFSVSQNGCGLTWSGSAPLPAVGIPMDVRLGAGNRAATLRSVVAWTQRSGRTATVGLRFVSGASSAWTMMMGEVKSSGAPPA
jgi:hypothetical protein